MKLHRLFLVFFSIAAFVLRVEAKRTSGDEGGPDRTLSALAMHDFNARRPGTALTSLQPALIKDRGNVSILQDDGTLIIAQNRFDLAGRSLTFTPQGGGYQLQSGAAAFDAGQGGLATLTLQDDDSIEVSLPFTFAFYAARYTSVYINTDGNLTFGAGDADSGDRDLRRVIQGSPRIAPALDDLLPDGIGHVAIEKLSDRVIVDWVSITEYGLRTRSTFQVVLRSSGVIQLNYQTMNMTAAVVALSPGNRASLQLLDLSAQTSPANVTATVAEVFSTINELDLPAISSAFYATHQDAYDALIVFSDFNISLQDAFAYEIPVRNDIQGIMPAYGTFDYSAGFGSTQRLSSIVNAGSIGQYPNDPREIVFGTNNTLDILGQEFGHRWLAFVDTSPSSMLGRDRAHWSFFMNSEGSVMEGNQIQDQGNGTFRTIGATFKYSALDQYVMGLRPPSEVPSWFVITSPRLVSAPSGFNCTPLNAACAPAIGVVMSGTRRDITINNVVATAGPRIPAYENAQRDFSVAFILLTRNVQEADPISIAHVDAIRQGWQDFFPVAVDGRGTMATKLQYPTVTQIDLDLAASGSAFVETARTPTLQTGYSKVQSAVSAAVVRSFSGSDLVSEAAIPATSAARNWLIYAEREGSVATGLAIANPNASPANLSLTLSNGSRTTIQIPANGQRAAFVFELFSGLQSFLGTLAIDSDVAVAVVALRGAQNINGDFIVTTIPVTSGIPDAGVVTAFPMIADGGGYKTEMILVNAGAATSTGTIRLLSGDRIPFSVSPGGVWKFQTSGSAKDVSSGSAILEVESGPTPAAVAVIRFSTAGGLVSEVGVPAQRLISNALTFGSYDTILRTSIALLSPSASGAQVRLTARNGDGQILGTTATVALAGASRLSVFVDELIRDLPSGFDGTVVIEASSPIYAVAFRGSAGRNGAFIMAALPVIDTNRVNADVAYFPQIVVGSNYTTEFLVGNTDSGSAHLTFLDSQGAALAIAFQ